MQVMEHQIEKKWTIKWKLGSNGGYIGIEAC